MQYEGKLYGRVGKSYFLLVETSKDVDAMKEKIADLERENKELKDNLSSFRNDVRKAFAEYKRSEGCGCCQVYPAHTTAENKLGELLGAEKYKDGSGYDWYINK